VKIEGALQTLDGAWRVEIVKRGKTRWYRIVSGDNELDWLSIKAVERVLSEAGVEIADLVDAPALTTGEIESRRSRTTAG
jgi:bifunctional non-homologous end joining protein LigD